MRKVIAIRRSRERGRAGGRNQKALARLHSARSLNRSQGFTAGCRGSSLAPLGRRSSWELSAEVEGLPDAVCEMIEREFGCPALIVEGETVRPPRPEHWIRYQDLMTA